MVCNGWLTLLMEQQITLEGLINVVFLLLYERARGALIGVIYNFNTNEMYSAIKGHGAFLNNEK